MVKLSPTYKVYGLELVTASPLPVCYCVVFFCVLIPRIILLYFCSVCKWSKWRHIVHLSSCQWCCPLSHELFFSKLCKTSFHQFFENRSKKHKTFKQVILVLLPGTLSNAGFWGIFGSKSLGKKFLSIDLKKKNAIKLTFVSKGYWLQCGSFTDQPVRAHAS